MWRNRLTAWIWDHPIRSLVGLVVLTLAAATGVTAFFTNTPPAKLIVSVIGLLGGTGNVLLGLITLAGMAGAVMLALVLYGGLTHFRNTSESRRLEADELRTNVARIEKRLDDGDFFIRADRRDREGDTLGRVIWREADVEDVSERGYLRLRPLQLAKLTEKVESVQAALTNSEVAREVLAAQLNQERHSHAGCKAEFAKAKLSLLKLAPAKLLLVRYLEPDDALLAEHVERLFKLTGWQTTLKRDGDSHLIQNTMWRIEFGSVDPDIVKRLSIIFNEGNLLAEAVSPYELFAIEAISPAPDVLVTIFPKPKA